MTVGQASGHDIHLGLPPEEMQMPVHRLWEPLANQDERNRITAAEIVGALASGKRSSRTPCAPSVACGHFAIHIRERIAFSDHHEVPRIRLLDQMLTAL